MAEPKTLLDAVRHFSNLDTCDEYLIALKYPDGIRCPSCNHDQIGRIVSRRKLQCKNAECRAQFSAKIGTIFEDSPLGLDKWFVAVWAIANAKNGISSCELSRAIGVTQKTAWFMLHRIRAAMDCGSVRKFNGEVFADLLGALVRVPKDEADARFAEKFPAAAKRLGRKKRKKKGT